MEARTRALLCNSGMGKAIFDRLRVELGLPSRVTWFELRFEVGEVVRVRCEYHPVEPVDEAQSDAP